MTIERTGFLRAHPRLLAFLLVLLLVQILELFLLQRKYDLFTGGFLQPHSFLSIKERGLFLGLSLWMDAIVYGGSAAIWFRLADRWKVNPLRAAYNFVFLFSVTVGGWLVLKYKVLSYFNDTLDFLVIKNLGGGSIYQALSFVAQESSILGIAVVSLVAAYWLGKRLLRRAEIDATGPSERPQFPLPLVTVGLVVTVGLAQWVNADSALHYGLRKKTSFSLIGAVLNRATDVDLDGFGLLSHARDPAPFDSTIYPGALDIPGNGIDEDGYAGDFLWNGSVPDPLESLTPLAGDHIVLIVLESARADLLNQTIGSKPVAPVISQLARQGTSLPYVYSHAGFTTSALRALFNRSLSGQIDRVRLIDYLQRSGYQLSFVSGEDESFGGIAEKTGMSNSGNYLFHALSALDDRVYPSKNPGSLRLSEQRVVRQFIHRSREVDWDSSQFFYINLQAAHFPYHHPEMPAILNDRPIPRSEITEDNSAWLEDTYWNAIAVADRAIGDILRQLEKLGAMDQTVVMILSDHGESLFDDHFLGHGHALNEIQTRIPLVVNRPDLSVSCALGQTDVAELLVRLATNRFDKTICKRRDKSVLQIIGSLDNPQLVGTVSAGETRTILDTRTNMLFFSDLRKWEQLTTALNTDHLRVRTRQLLDLWASARWQNYLARQRENVRRN